MLTSSVLSRERTQGRPEGPAPAAPPPSAVPSRRLPGRVRAGRRGTVPGGDRFQLGRVPGHGVGELAAERHVVGGDLAPAGVGDRDVGRAVPDGQDGRGIVVGAAADVGAGGQPDVGLDRDLAVRRRTGPLPWRSCRHLLATGQRHQVRPLRHRHRAPRRPWRSACTGPAPRAAAAGPGTGVRLRPRRPRPWRRAGGRSRRARPPGARAGSG